MKIFITGSQGVTGKRLSIYLNNYFDLKVSYFRKLPGDIPNESVKMDITKAIEVKKAVKDVEAIIHLAATGIINYDEVTFIEANKTNVMGTLNLLQAAVESNIKKFIYISSIRVYSLPTDETTVEYFPIDEEHPFKAYHPYGLSKILAEDLCRGFTRGNDIDVLCLRPGHIMNVTPEGDEYKKYTTKKELEKAKGMLYTHVDIRDLGQAIKLALGSNISGFEAFNIVGEDHIFDIDSLDFIKKFYPNVKDIRNIEQFRKKRKSLIDISKAERLLGYKPQYSYGRYLKSMEAGKSRFEYFKINKE